MGFLGRYLGGLKTLLRDRDQLTVELAEEGIAPEDERDWTEEQVARHRRRHEESEPGTPAEDE